MKRIREFFQNIPEELCISKCDFFLTIAVCVLSGILFGFLFSPKKTVVIGSNNGNGYTLPGAEEEEEALED